MQKIIQLLILLLAVSYLTGCTSSIHIDLQGAKQLNLDQHHKSLPVDVRIYQLHNKNNFMQATFNELWQKDSDILGEDFIDKTEVTVMPGKSTQTCLDIKTSCHYIGIIAIFRKPADRNWRVLYTLPRDTKILSLTIKAQLHKNKITRRK